MDLFFSNLFVQFLQVLALNFGLGLLQTAGGGSAGFLQFISGAATLLLAFRIPALTAAGVGGGATSFLGLVALFRGLQTMGQPGSSANLGLLPGPDSGASTGPLAAIIPADQLAVMEQVAAATPCAIPWSVLAGVAYIESDFGQNLGPSSAGAYGYAQFCRAPGPAMAATSHGARAIPLSRPRRRRSGWTPATFTTRYQPWQPICARWPRNSASACLRTKLCGGRSSTTITNHARGVAYDPSDAYVNDVLGFALRVGAGQ